VIQECNLYESPEPAPDNEVFSILFQNPALRIESIRSWLNHPGEWYNQSEDEWVVLLEGKARLEIHDGIVELNRGDSLFIPKHTPHRVVWTSKNAHWLGVFNF